MNDLTRYKLCAGLAIPPAAKLIYFYLMDRSNGHSIAISVKPTWKEYRPFTLGNKKESLSVKASGYAGYSPSVF